VLNSKERIDYEEYVMGQTLEPLIKTRGDYEIYLAYVEEWLKSIEPIKESKELEEMEREIGDDGVQVTWRTHTFYSFSGP